MDKTNIRQALARVYTERSAADRAMHDGRATVRAQARRQWRALDRAALWLERALED